MGKRRYHPTAADYPATKPVNRKMIEGYVKQVLN